MDRRDGEDVDKQKQVFGPSAEQSAEEKKSHFINEEGKNYRMPYKIIRKATFKNLDQKQLIDIPHSARLQYRLLLFDAVIKAKVDFHKKFIRIVYNPPDADNIREKMSRDQLIAFLSSEGVTVHSDPANMEEVDYDYYKELYSYAYFSPSIRESPPYGWTKEEWKKEKERVEKMKYRQEHPTITDKIFTRIFGAKNPAQKKSSGMTLHP